MYQLLMSKIEQSPFHQYEISNFALDGHESEHNKVTGLMRNIMDLEQVQVVGCTLYEYQSSETLYEAYK